MTLTTELNGLANHIASAKGGLPQEWQDWAEEIEADIRKLANREAQPSITDDAIDRIVVPLNPEGLDEEKHHCEWHLYHDRERIRKELREYFAAPPAPAVPDIKIQKAILWLDGVIQSNPGMKEPVTCRAAMLKGEK